MTKTTTSISIAFLTGDKKNINVEICVAHRESQKPPTCQPMNEPKFTFSDLNVAHLYSFTYWSQIKTKRSVRSEMNELEGWTS